MMKQVQRWLRAVFERLRLRQPYQWIASHWKNMNKRWVVAAMILTAVIALALLTVFVMIFPNSDLDRKLAYEIQKEDAFYLPFLMRFVSFFGEPFADRSGEVCGRVAKQHNQNQENRFLIREDGCQNEQHDFERG